MADLSERQREMLEERRRKEDAQAVKAWEEDREENGLIRLTEKGLKMLKEVER